MCVWDLRVGVRACRISAPDGSGQDQCTNVEAHRICDAFAVASNTKSVRPTVPAARSCEPLSRRGGGEGATLQLALNKPRPCRPVKRQVACRVPTAEAAHVVGGRSAACRLVVTEDEGRGRPGHAAGRQHQGNWYHRQRKAAILYSARREHCATARETTAILPDPSQKRRFCRPLFFPTDPTRYDWDPAWGGHGWSGGGMHEVAGIPLNRSFLMADDE
jgi:hypothetical protein